MTMQIQIEGMAGLPIQMTLFVSFNSDVMHWEDD